MAIYRGISNVARQLTTQYRGVSNVARKISKEYLGVNNVARLVFGNDYRVTTFMNDEALYNSYSFDIEGDTIGMHIVTSGGVSSVDGNIIKITIWGDFSSKTITFDYVPITSFSGLYSSIFYIEGTTNTAGVESTKKYLHNGEGSYSGTIMDGCERIEFYIWIENNVTANKEVSITISNLKIDGEKVVL